MRPFSRIHQLLSSALLAAFLATAVVSPGNAATESEVYETNDPEFFDLDPSQEAYDNPFVSESEITLDSEPGPGPDDSFSTMNVRVGNNPYNCRGASQNVHKSGGMASLHTRIEKCSRKIGTLANGAEIMKAGWFGQWHRQIFFGRERANVLKLDTNAKAVCKSTSTQSYRGNGYHRMTHAGKTWTARTSSPKETRFACNT